MLTAEQKAKNHQAYLKYAYKNKLKRIAKAELMTKEEEEMKRKAWRETKILRRAKKLGNKRYAMIGGKHCAELARVLEKAGYEVYFKNKNLPDYYLNNFTLEERVKYALYKCN